MNQISTFIVSVLALAAALGFAGCDGNQGPSQDATQPGSDGDPNVTVLPDEVRSAYHTVMDTQVKPDFRNMRRAFADDNLETVSTQARGILAALKNLEREHGRCPVDFVKLHRTFRNALETVVEFADGPGDRTQLEILLGENGTVGKSCDDCHAKYLGG